jgi:hypothetical protein
MQPVTIRTYAGADICVASSAELAGALRALSSEHHEEPLLVYLYPESGDIMLFGVGAAYTTIEFVTGDRHFRSLGSLPPAPESVPFIFQGELTEVWPEHLIPQAAGERAVISWLADGILDDSVAWREDTFPPRRHAQP